MNEITYAGRTFSGDDIKSGSCYLAMSLLSDVLEINTLSFEVESEDQSLVSFRRNTPMVYSYNGSQVGIFYAQTVKRVGSSTYSFYATSAIGLLDQVTHYGGIYTGQTVGELVRELCGSVPSVIKGNIRDVKLYGWLPIATCRANLSQVLFAAGASVKTDLDGVIRIENLWDGVSGEIGMDRLFLGGKVEYAAAVSRVEVTEHQYVEGGESAKLFEGTTQSGDIITFSEPMYSLSASGFSILARGANYAKVSAGSGTLTGQKYVHNTRQVVKAVSGSRSGDAENVRTVKDATLVSLVNSAAVAERLSNYCRCVETISSEVVFRQEMPGDLKELYHPYDKETVAACIQSEDIHMSGTLRAAERCLVGFVPPQFSQSVGYDQRQFLIGNGTWTVPEGVTSIRAVLIGGGTGGFSGLKGENAPAQTMENLSDAHWMHRTYRYAYTDGGEGGKAGNGGAGGKIYQVTFDVTPGQKLSYSCGTGGLGGVYSASGMVSGRAGGNTTIEGHSSASGSASENGFYDPTVNQIFGGAGEPGMAGGKGCGKKGDDTADDKVTPAAGPNIVYNGTTYIPGNTTQTQDAKDVNLGMVNNLSNHIVAACTEGLGGGAAPGGNGQNGSAGSSSASKSGSGRASATGGQGGTGGTAAKPSAQTKFGYGGKGGNGGGGGGSAGVGHVNYSWNGATGSPAPLNPTLSANPGIPGPGGPGSDGGAGGPGCIILYFTQYRPTPSGALMDKNHKIVFDKFGRLIVA